MASLYASDGRELYLGRDGDTVVVPLLHPGRYELRIADSPRPTRLEITEFDIAIPAFGPVSFTTKRSSQAALPSVIYGVAALAAMMLLVTTRRTRHVVSVATTLLVGVAGPLRVLDAATGTGGVMLAVLCAGVLSVMARAASTRRFVPVVALVFPPLVAPALVFVPVVAAFTLSRASAPRRAVITLSGLASTVLVFVVAASLTPAPPASMPPRSTVDRLADCSAVTEPGDRSDCAVGYFMSRINGGISLDAVLTELADTQFDEVFISGGSTNCHTVGHSLGRRLYEAGFSPGELGAQAGLCGSGLLHGITEEAGVSADPMAFAALAASCELDNSSHAYACSHGIGHGVYARTGGDVASAVTLCEQLSGVVVGECVGGALMIYADAWSSFARFGTWPEHVRPFPIVADPLDACLVASMERHRQRCIQAMLEVYRNYTFDNVNPETSDIDAAVRWCAQRHQYRDSCADGLGSAVNGYVTAVDPVKVVDVCSMTDVQRCTKAFAYVYAQNMLLSGKRPTTEVCAALGEQATVCRKEMARVTAEDPRSADPSARSVRSSNG